MQIIWIKNIFAFEIMALVALFLVLAIYLLKNKYYNEHWPSVPWPADLWIDHSGPVIAVLSIFLPKGSDIFCIIMLFDSSKVAIKELQVTEDFSMM